MKYVAISALAVVFASATLAQQPEKLHLHLNQLLITTWKDFVVRR